MLTLMLFAQTGTRNYRYFKSLQALNLKESTDSNARLLSLVRISLAL